MLPAEWVLGGLMLGDREGGRREPLHPVTCGAIGWGARQRRFAGVRVGVAGGAAGERRLGSRHRTAVACVTIHAAVLAEERIARGAVVEFLAINHGESLRHMATAARCGELATMGIAVAARALVERQRPEPRDALSVGPHWQCQRCRQMALGAGDVGVLPREWVAACGMIELQGRRPVRGVVAALALWSE